MWSSYGYGTPFSHKVIFSPLNRLPTTSYLILETGLWCPELSGLCRFVFFKGEVGATCTDCHRLNIATLQFEDFTLKNTKSSKHHSILHWSLSLEGPLFFFSEMWNLKYHVCEFLCGTRYIERVVSGGEETFFNVLVCCLDVVFIAVELFCRDSYTCNKLKEG